MSAHESAGHGMDHINQVYDLGMRIHENEGGNRDIIALAILLHDVDDYKFFGDENAQNLTNAKRIMNQCGVDVNTQTTVCEIISTMGWSRLLAGIRPTTLEGRIVSDADMCGITGALAIVRTAQFGKSINRPFFIREKWPRTDIITAEEYKKFNDSSINYFFERLLKMQGLLFTDTAKQIAAPGHDFIIAFLRRYFIENNAPAWNEYLDKFLAEL